jgi:hypothetical protein
MINSPEHDMLTGVLNRAYAQAMSGKGYERHGTNDLPFEEQISCWIEKQGAGYALGQSAKKIFESLRMEPKDAVKELLGAINYICIAIIVLEEKVKKEA